MLRRRGLLKALFIAPAIIPGTNLMHLSWRSSKLLTPPVSPLLTFQIEKTVVRAGIRRLAENWTFEQPQECWFEISDEVVEEIAAEIAVQAKAEELRRRFRLALARSFGFNA